MPPLLDSSFFSSLRSHFADALPLPAWLHWAGSGIAILAVLIGAYLLMKLVRWTMRRLAHLLEPERAPVWADEAVRGIRPAVAVIVAILAMWIMLRAAGRPSAAAWNPERLLDWLLTHGLRITLIIACAYLVLRSVHMVISRADLLIPPQDNSPVAKIESGKRAQTVRSLLQRISTVIVLIVTALMLLSEVGVNTVPILTGLGVVGVAVGFGAQWLVGDLISGFFLIFENQIRVGDAATINGVSGLVQDLRMRTTILRSFDGAVHVFRNGAIQTLSNMTKDYSYFTLDVTVAYLEDPERVAGVLREVAAELIAEPDYASLILAPLEIFGMESFSETSIVIRMRLKTLPSKQWEVGREFRKRLTHRMQQEHIALPGQTPAPPAPVSAPGPSL